MKVCIVKTSALGDIVQSLHIVDYLAARRPALELDWVVESRNAELVRAHRGIRHVWELDRSSWRSIWTLRQQLQQQRYDAIFDLQGNLKSALVLSQMRSRSKVGFGWRTVPERINLTATNVHIDPPAGRNRREDYLHLVQSYLGDRVLWDSTKVSLQGATTEQAPMLLLCPGSRWPTKQLALQQWDQFLSCLADLPLQWGLVWGSEPEKQLVESLHERHPANTSVMPKCTLEQLIGLLSSVRAVVSVDSFPLHLAGLQGVPTLSFFGPSVASVYAPLGERHDSVQGDCPYGLEFPRRCPKLRRCPTGACLKSLAPEAMADKFRNWWAETVL
jgi:heptosyltransferase I